MKKISKLLALTACFATLFFAACSDVDTDSGSTGTVSNSVNDITSNKKTYSVSFASSDDKLLPLSSFGISANKAGSDRTIVAAGEKGSDLTFYLWGTNLVTNATVPISKVDFTADKDDDDNEIETSGSVVLDLAVSNYKLVLAAVKTAPGTVNIANVTGAALYIGYANVDLRNTSSIKFYISADGLTGDAKCALTFVYDGLTGDSGTWTSEHKTLVNDAEKYKITASIRDRSDDSALSGFGSTEGNVTNADFFNTGKLLSGTVTPGTYNLQVDFYCVATEKHYYWSDLIIMLPNQTVTAAVKVPDVIEYAPEPPTALKVGYVKPATTTTTSYTAVLNWEDNSYTEQYFKVAVADVTELSTFTAAVDDDAKWGTAVTGIAAGAIKEYGKDFYGNLELREKWVAGSLQKNNTYIALQLTLGKRYLVRICASSDAGDSTWAYATYDLGVATDAGVTWNDTDPHHTGSYTAHGFAIKTIDASKATAANGYNPYVAAETPVYAITANLYRLSYHLNGGEIAFAAAVKTKNDLIYYLSQDLVIGEAPSATGGIPILDPHNDPTAASVTYPTLVSDGNRWTSWREGIVEGTKYDSTSKKDGNFTYFEPANYGGYTSLDLFASYTVASGSVNIYRDSDYDFKAGEVVLANGSTVLGSDPVYTVYTSATSVTLTYTLKTERESFTYNSLFAEIKRNGKLYAKGNLDSSGNWSFVPTNLNVGTYQITVYGEYNGHQYSYPITMKVQDPVVVTP